MPRRLCLLAMTEGRGVALAEGIAMAEERGLARGIVYLRNGIVKLGKEG